MIQNFISALETGIWEPLYNQLLLILVFWVAITISVIIDLYMAVACSRMAGKKLQSNKLRKSVHKINKYLILLLIGFLFDLVISILPFWNIPFASLIFTIIIMGIETLSIIENFNLKKEVVVQLFDVATKMVQCKDVTSAIDIIREVADEKFIRKHKEELKLEKEASQEC